MHPTFKKVFRLLKFTFYFLGILFLLVVGSINLPFFQERITAKVNSLLKERGIPVRAGKLTLLLNGKIGLRQLQMIPVAGDTLVYAGEVNIFLNPLSLFNHKIVISDVSLQDVVVYLKTDPQTGELDALKLLSGSPSPADSIVSAAKKKPAVPWEFEIGEIHLKNVRFRYEDTKNGIQTEEQLQKADVEFNDFSVLKKEINAEYIGLEKVNGKVVMKTVAAAAEHSDTSPSAWKFSCLKFHLKEVNFDVEQNEIQQHMVFSLLDGTIVMKSLDLAAKKLLLSDINLLRPELYFQTGAKTGTKPALAVDSLPANSAQDWSLEAAALTISQGAFNMKAPESGNNSPLEQWLPLRDFNTSIKNIRYTPRGYGFSVSKLSMALKEKAMLESGEIFFESDTQKKIKVSLTIKAAINNGTATQLQHNTGINLSAIASGSMDSLQIDKLELGTSSGINIALHGSLNDVLNIPYSKCDLAFKTNTVSRQQTHELLSFFAVSTQLPEFKPFVISGNVSNTFVSPQFRLFVLSASGNIALAGKYNTALQSGNLEAGLASIRLSDMFGATYPKELTARVTLNGELRNRKEWKANLDVKVKSITYPSFTAHAISVLAAFNKQQCNFKIQAKDAALACDVKGLFAWQNNTYRANCSGQYNINPENKAMVPEGLGMKGELYADFFNAGNKVDASLDLKNTQLSNAVTSTALNEVTLTLKGNNNKAECRVLSDFLKLDFQGNSSFNEILVAVKRAGFESYIKPDSAYFINAEAFEKFPLFKLSAALNYHKCFDYFVPDSILGFKSVLLNMEKTGSAERIHANFSMDDFYYKNFSSEGLVMTMTTEEDTLKCRLMVDALHLDSTLTGPAVVSIDVCRNKIQTRLDVKDRTGASLYRMGAEAVKHQGNIEVFASAEDWIINTNLWKIHPTSLFNWNSKTGDVIANTHLQNGDMKIDIYGNTAKRLSVDLKEVHISSLLPINLIRTLPEGIVNANLIYQREEQGTLDFVADIKQLKWEDLFVNHLTAEGQLVIDTTGIPNGKFTASLNDSSTLKVNRVEEGSVPGKKIQLAFNDFPVKLLEPFLGKYVDELKGNTSGTIFLTQVSNKNILDGNIHLKGIELTIVPLKAWFSIPDEKLRIKENKFYFDRFVVLDSLQKRLYVDGTINAENTDKITTDLKVSTDNLQVLNTTLKDNPVFFGSIMVKSALEIKGPLISPQIKGNVLLEKGTNVTYRHIEDISVKEANAVITFAALDSNHQLIVSQKERWKELKGNPLIQTVVEITPKSIFNVEYSSNYELHVGISGQGILNYAMLPNNTISLTGNYEILNGATELKFVGWPLKKFSITPGSSFRWDGKVDDPELNLEATSTVKGSYMNPVDNKERTVDFIVAMKLSNLLSKLEIVFEVKSPDQYITSVFNSLSQDEIMKQAVNLLLFETINLPNIESSGNYMSSQINSFWETQLNALTRTKFKYADLSFGIDTYTQATSGGGEEQKTAVTYELERKMMNNRASVKLSGRLSDDQNPGSTTNPMIENFIFEYALDTLNKRFIKIYRRQDYEDILDGEVIKSGVGFIFRRSYPTFRDIWYRKSRNKSEHPDPSSNKINQ